MRLLHQWHDHAIRRAAGAQPDPDGTADQSGADEQSLPLRNPSPHRACGETRRRHLTRARTMNAMIDRRTLLQATGALIVTFSLKPGLGRAQPTPAAKTVSPDRVDGFLAIETDGTVLVYSGKVDLGTGVRTALTQIVAEELDVPMSRVTVVQGHTALTPDQGPTSGSLSIQNAGMQLRRAAATARRALLEKTAAVLAIHCSPLTIPA